MPEPQETTADGSGHQYPGMELDRRECTLRAYKFIKDPKLLAAELPLFRTKWFDMRRLHFTKATYYFAECYRNAYSQAMRVRYDANRAQYMRGLKGDAEGDIFAMKRTEYVGLWKARQLADELGIPYDFYCNWAMRFSEQNDWRYMPRPTQLRSDAMRCFIHNKWQEQCATSLVEAEDPFYRAESFIGAPDQMDYQFWLCDLISQRTRPEFLLHHLMVERGELQEGIARETLSEDLIREAKSL